MDSKVWFERLHPPTGSKRPSLSPSNGDSPQAKKHRTQPAENPAECEVISTQLSFSHGGSQWPDTYYSPSTHFNTSWGDAMVYGRPSNSAIYFDIGYGHNCEIPSGYDASRVGNFDNELLTVHPNVPSGMGIWWDVSSQGPSQGHGNYSDTVIDSEAYFGHYLSTFAAGENAGVPHDALGGMNEQKAVLHSTHNQAQGKTTHVPFEPGPIEASEVCCDYDTCFGVVSHLPYNALSLLTA